MRGRKAREGRPAATARRSASALRRLAAAPALRGLAGASAFRRLAGACAALFAFACATARPAHGQWDVPEPAEALRAALEANALALAAGPPAEREARPRATQAETRGRSLLRRSAGILKWVTLAGTAALAGAGFKTHEDADDAFARLENACNAQPDRCRATNPDGSFADPELEAMFQEVLDRDRAAQAYLVGSQIAFAATVALFIVDLENGRGPENIPYEPQNLRLRLSPGELRLAWYPP